MRLATALVLAAVLAGGPALAQDATTPAAPAEAPAAPAEPAPPAAPAEPAPPAAPAPVEIPLAADIGPTVDRDFWCAIAFSLTSRAAQMSADEPLATSEAQKSQVLFASIVGAMQSGNFQEAQFNAMTSQYTARALDPFAPAEGRFTREVCETASVEAQATVDAMAAAAEAAQPATPDAPAADAPAADAPAAPEAPAEPAPGAPADAPAAQ